MNRGYESTRIVVCANCSRACCLDDIRPCPQSQRAGTKVMTIRLLRELQDREERQWMVHEEKAS